MLMFVLGVRSALQALQFDREAYNKLCDGRLHAFPGVRACFFVCIFGSTQNW